MGREVRMVPADWEHPKSERGGYEPLHEGYAARLKEFEDKAEKDGMEAAIEYYGGGPLKDEYMPDFPEGTATHLMMYETCTEWTPISPAFATPEELAHWLADTGASSFGGMTSPYEAWLRVCQGGYAPSAVFDSEKGLRSGVEL